MTVDEKINALVKKEYMDKIPSDVMRHVLTGPIQLIKREHADLYHKFETNTETEADIREMSDLINAIFKQRLIKHHMM